MRAKTKSIISSTLGGKLVLISVVVGRQQGTQSPAQINVGDKCSVTVTYDLTQLTGTGEVAQDTPH